MKFHHFSSDISGIELPTQFTFPFHYIPHQLSKIAANEVEKYLQSRNDWNDELNKGKMFGVLIVRDPVGEIGYLAAFSGNLAHSNNHEFFVPPVYDLLNPEGQFRIGEAEISEINHKINVLENSPELISAVANLSSINHDSAEAIESYRVFMANSKIKRDTARSNDADEATLIAESQFQKAEFKRLKESWAQKTTLAKNYVDTLKTSIYNLKLERKAKSAALQNWIFQQFKMHNALGEVETLSHIFATTPQGTPPAGSGECAAPKLLQYAFLNNLSPIAMAEFWWGESPTDVIRHHGHFYGACKNKCEPILNFMLKGLDVEPNELESASKAKLDIIYQDPWILIVNKPAWMLSVPGKVSTDSVLERVKAICPQADGPIIVHRLDMATSGLIIIALNKDVHKCLQSMFKSRKINKRYVALLEGIVKSDEGTINLPLCMHPDDRPRQTVSLKYGKLAITEYHVTSRNNGITRIIFHPLTGRTHQLRVHAAHHNGLNAPIVGDRLYGHYATRMYLHAEALEFEHPVTHQIIKVEAEASF